MDEIEILTELEILVRVRELLSEPTRWIKGHRATTNNGLIVEPNDFRATCFCLFGAITKVSPLDTKARWAVSTFLDQLAEKRGYAHYVSFNDDSDHEDVLSLLDEAITITQKA